MLLLLENGADIEAHEPIFGTSLSQTARFSDERIVRILVGKGAKANAEGGYWGPALGAAIGSPKWVIINYLNNIVRLYVV